MPLFFQDVHPFFEPPSPSAQTIRQVIFKQAAMSVGLLPVVSPSGKDPTPGALAGRRLSAWRVMVSSWVTPDAQSSPPRGKRGGGAGGAAKWSVSGPCHVL